MGAGPLRLLDAGLTGRLEAAGRDVRVSILETPPDLWPGEVAAAFDLARQVGGAVASAIAAHEFPLVLSGNCGPAALGCVAGVRVSRVYWFDAHGDFNTPETTIGGFLDGMALATLTGHCWRALAAQIDGFRSVPESAVTLIGARDLDPLEADALARSAITQVSPSALAQWIDALHGEPAGEPAYVHLDLDVLDPSHGRMNSYAATGGLTLAQLEDVLAALRRHTRIVAASITAFDPAADVTAASLETALRLAEALAAN